MNKDQFLNDVIEDHVVVNGNSHLRLRFLNMFRILPE